MKRRVYLYWLACALLTALTGCVRQSFSEGDSPGIRVIRSANVRLDAEVSTPSTIYLSIRNAADAPVSGLSSLLEGILEARGYTRAAGPSQAGYILHLSVIHAGPMGEEAARRSVSPDYGGRIYPPGRESQAIVADILAAVRTLPAQKSRKPFLASVSRRSAVAGVQTRIAALLPEGKNASFEQARGALEHAMAKAAADMLPMPTASGLP